MYNSGNSSKNVRGSNIIDGTVETVDIADDAVTVAKLDNAINTDIATGVSGKAIADLALPKAGGAMTGAITNSSTYNGMLVQTASGVVADVTVFTLIATFPVPNRSTFKVVIGSGVAGNTHGYYEYLGYTGGAGTDAFALTTSHRNNAWEAYYELINDRANDQIIINARRGTNAARLSQYTITVISAT
jgi:hypothetical protein